MLQSKKRMVIILLLATVLLCFLGALSVNGIKVKAEETYPTIKMLAGAGVRMDEENPGIKFTAEIENFDKDLSYGMMILPKPAFSKFDFSNANYHKVLTDNGIVNDENNIRYADKICLPYFDEGVYKISFSLVGINGNNYLLEFVGIAYILDDGNYTYSDVNLTENARSVTFVSQMALKYQDGLTDKQIQNLQTYQSFDGNTLTSNELISPEQNFIEIGTTESKPAVKNYVAKIEYAKSKSGYHTFQTKVAYSKIKEVTFDAYVPEESPLNCWGISFSPNNQQEATNDMFALANLQQYVIKNCWVTYKIVSTDYKNWTVWYGERGTDLVKAYVSESYYNTSENKTYLFFTSLVKKSSNTILIDNVTFKAGNVEYTDGFDNGESQYFEQSVPSGYNPVTFEEVESQEQEPDDSVNYQDKGYAVLDFSKVSNQELAFVSNQKFSGVTEVKVDVYIPSTNKGQWWGIIPVADKMALPSVGEKVCSEEFNVQNLLKTYRWTDTWVTLKYQVSTTWWTLSIAKAGSPTSNESILVDFTDDKYNSSEGFYLAFCAPCVNGKIYVDNIIITTKEQVFSDDFNLGESSLMELGQCVNLYYESAKFQSEQNIFNSQLANNQLIDHLLTSNALFETVIETGEGVEKGNLAVLSASFGFYATEYKEIFITLTEEGENCLFIRVCSNLVEVYLGKTLLESVRLDCFSAKVDFTLQSDDTFMIRVNGNSFITVGKLQQSIDRFKILDFSGTGNISVFDLSVCTYGVTQNEEE